MFFGKKSSSIDPNDEHRDFRLLESIVKDAFEEQKKSRRWGVLFKSLTFAYLFFALLMVFIGASRSSVPGLSNKPHTAVVRIDGVIADQEPASGAKLNTALRNAFDNEYAVAVMLVMNTPGGSPVQSAYVYDEILRLSALHPSKKVYAVIKDIGASGGYYIASAAHEIYANRSSLVGSIGVTASSFGFVEVMDKLGIERRHFTAGEHKAFLDPFSPLKPEEKAFWNDVLASTHTQFIDAVQKGRGDRLKLNDTITSGLIWNGEQALALGLVDGLGSPSYVARDIIGTEDMVDYTLRESRLQALLNDLALSTGKGMARYIVNHQTGIELR